MTNICYNYAKSGEHAALDKSVINGENYSKCSHYGMFEEIFSVSIISLKLNKIWSLFLQVSKACKSICEWVRAMHKYHFVARGVAPKREALRIAQADLAETQRILDAAMKRLQEVKDGIATLQAKYDDCMRKKAELEDKCQECEARLGRADKVWD